MEPQAREHSVAKHRIAHPELQIAGLEPATAAGMRRRTAMLVATTMATLVLAPFFPAWNMLAMLPAVFVRRIASAPRDARLRCWPCCPRRHLPKYKS